MKTAYLTVLIVFIFSTSALAERPTKMLDFLPPGTHVGVNHPKETTSVEISVYAENEFDLAKRLADSNRFYGSAETVVKDHPQLEDQLDEFKKKLRQRTPDADLEKIRVLPNSTAMGTIRETGSDFILIEFKNERTRRVIVPKSKISTIELDARAVRFVTPRYPAR